MLRYLLDSVEFRVCVLAFIVLRLAGLYWLGVVTGKFFMREPLLYAYSAQAYTQETVPVAAALAVQLVSITYQLLTRTVWGRAMDSLVLFMASPIIAAL